MKVIELKGTARANTGKSNTKKVRNAGLVPCVMYGLTDPTHFSLDSVSVDKMLSRPETFVYEIDIDGSSRRGIIRDSQFHPTTDACIHIDFLEVVEGRPAVVQLPIRLLGTAKGVLNGGRLVTLMRKLKVRGVPADLPDFIDIDVTDLGLGQTKKVADIDFGSLEIMTPSSTGVAAVDIPRAARQALMEAAANSSDDEDED